MDLVDSFALLLEYENTAERNLGFSFTSNKETSCAPIHNRQDGKQHLLDLHGCISNLKRKLDQMDDKVFRMLYDQNQIPSSAIHKGNATVTQNDESSKPGKSGDAFLHSEEGLGLELHAVQSGKSDSFAMKVPPRVQAVSPQNASRMLKLKRRYEGFPTPFNVARYTISEHLADQKRFQDRFPQTQLKQEKSLNIQQNIQTEQNEKIHQTNKSNKKANKVAKSKIIKSKHEILKLELQEEAKSQVPKTRLSLGIKRRQLKRKNQQYVANDVEVEEQQVIVSQVSTVLSNPHGLSRFKVGSKTKTKHHRLISENSDSEITTRYPPPTLVDSEDDFQPLKSITKDNIGDFGKDLVAIKGVIPSGDNSKSSTRRPRPRPKSKTQKAAVVLPKLLKLKGGTGRPRKLNPVLPLNEPESENNLAVTQFNELESENNPTVTQFNELESENNPTVTPFNELESEKNASYSI